MATTHTNLTVGKSYAVTSPNDCTVTDGDGVQVCEVKGGTQGFFVAQTTEATLSDNNARLTLVFKGAPALGGNGGGGASVTVDMVPVDGSANPIASGWAFDHEHDTSLHNTPEQAAQIQRLIANYGRKTSLPLPELHPEDPGTEHGEGEWTYQDDSTLQAAGYFKDSDMLAKHGRWPVYGVLLPWCNQATGSVNTLCELYDGTTYDAHGAVGKAAELPDICITHGAGTAGEVRYPWLWDALVYDSELGYKRPRRWKPSTAGEDGAQVDEWIDGVEGDSSENGELLWNWYDVNYIRCDNGNRRIVAISGEENSGFAETGDVDVGVAYSRRYIYCGRVQAKITTGGVEKWRDYMLLIISAGPLDDPDFDPTIKAFIRNHDNFRPVTVDGEPGDDIVLKLWKECQNYEWNETSGKYDAVPALYGLHSKYQSVLGGSNWSACLPRSQRGHMLTNVSHNGYVTSSSQVTDGVPVVDGNGVSHTKKGYTDYKRKGKGFQGSGMDRLCFIGLHLMMKTGSKNTQKYMRGVVDKVEYSVSCVMSTEQAIERGIIAEDPNGNKKAVVSATGISGFNVGDWVALGVSGSTGRDFGTAKKMVGQITAKSALQTWEETNYYILTIEPWEGYGISSFTTLSNDVIARGLPPCGVTDVLGKHDGSPVNLLSTNSSACRFFGTEYGMGAWNICMDVTFWYNDNAMPCLYYANPQQQRQTDSTAIRDLYDSSFTGTAVGFGRAASYYGADLVVDVENGLYYQTSRSDNKDASSSTCLADMVYLDGSKNSMRAYCAYGSASLQTGASAGVWGVDVNINGGTGLTSGNWYSCSCD